MTTIVVTGATGYIGARLLARAQADGDTVVSASRRRTLCGIPWIPFDLSDIEAFHPPADTDAIIHLAANTSADDEIDETEEYRAAQRLIVAARDCDARLIFVSSQAASETAPTAYGRIKWRIEGLVLGAGGTVVRFGQVYGGKEAGLFGTLVDLVRKLPVLPAFVPAPRVQPIHVDDCVRGLLALASGSANSAGLRVIGSSEPLSFTVFLRAIARHRLRRGRLFVPVPVFWMRLLVKLFSLVSPGAFGLARLASLFALPQLPPAGELGKLELRSLGAGMHPLGDDRRRLLAAEGMGLLTYILRTRPGRGVIKRYIRMIEALREGKPAGLPAWLYRRPFLLACLDGRSVETSPAIRELRWRIGAAMLIGEASVQGFERFLASGRSTFQPLAFAVVVMAVASEVMVRFATPCLRPVLRRVIRMHQE
jgi:nucleoside-diphosphate-sugar epimerase